MLVDEHLVTVVISTLGWSDTLCLLTLFKVLDVEEPVKSLGKLEVIGMPLPHGHM